MTRKNIQRIIYGIVILFLIVPFAFLMYINNNATQLGLDLQSYLGEAPLMTVQLVSVFLLPISGFILKSKWDDIQTENGENELYLSIVLLMFSQFFIGNTSYGILFIILLIFVTRYYTIAIRRAISSFSNIRHFLSTFAGEIVIVVLSICLQILASRLR